MADDKPTSNISPTEPTPAPATSSSSTAAVEGSGGNIAVAVTMVGRPTPSPDQLLLLAQPLSSSNSDSVSPHHHHADQNVEVSCQQPCDASSHGGKDAADAEELFISTPSPFKKQKSALALAGSTTDDKIETENSSTASTTEDQDHENDLPLLPENASTATDPIEEDSPSKSNFISASLLQLQSPDANVTDFDFLGQEVMAAASTASAMLSRYDGFDPMPAYSGGRVLFDGDATTMATTETTPMETVNAMGVVFSHYPYQDDAFPLPPYLQVHLDETHAESTAVDASEYDGVVSPMKGYASNSAPGTTPPSVSSRAHSHSDGTTTSTTEFNDAKVGGSRGKTLEQLAQAKKKQKSSAADKTRPRPLPLRKRKFVMKDSDDEEYQPSSSSKTKTSNVVKVKAKAPAADGKKRTLVRHNVREDGDRITCKCSKSKCLKVSLLTSC